ncbi:hypothetical protein TUM4438_43850 [Shewanella sairae]|uniref:Tetratricopeptide repeat protein n=1 Tax=Shewanella sairae TaxID=190310 RepID=A0ABQ4PRI9_9GAMM|nr:tetratricopeptide repeat protein [Shewanella sairae]MCL1132304.1 tetratricopeptide repeat protein [Shewanella sairae]GIU52085.1 hypothetical protein TUM4438_43850 [Shewanella sairae]
MSSGKTSGIFTFKISSERSTNPIYFELFDDEYHISLAGVASLRGSFTPPRNNDDLNTIVANINVHLAILLFKLRHNSESERLFDLFLPTSSSGTFELTLTSYVAVKAATNKISDALDYLLSLSTDGGLLSNETVNTIQLIMGMVAQLCTPDDYSKVESTFLSIIDEVKGIDLGLASVFHYNLGNHLAARGENRNAIKQYIFAAKSNPDYKLRFYWKRELAGLFFGIGKYRISSKLYESALSDDSSNEARGLFADSLMYSGFFKRALAEFELALSASESGDPEWCLKYWCLEQIVNELGVESQVIGPTSGSEFIVDCTEEDAANYLLKTNAMCPDCWFFIATKLAERSDFDGATVCFLLSAFSDESHKESWMRSLQCSMRAKSSVIMHHIILVVSTKFGNEAINDFFETLDDNANSKLNEMSLDVIMACEDYNDERRRKRFKLRFGDSNSQEVVEL